LFFGSPLTFEFNYSIDYREECIVTPQAYILTGVNTRTALLDQNGAGRYELPVEALDPQALAMAVPAVLGASYAFLMCHN
jgi:hypothetical protein